MNINGNRIDPLSNVVYRDIDLIFYHSEEEKKKKKLPSTDIGINGYLIYLITLYPRNFYPLPIKI